jgi:hypothetical protein
MSSVRVEVVVNQPAEQPFDGWNPSDTPIFREFLDHVADLIAQDYVRRMRETADPNDLQAWETGGQQ